MAVAGKVTVKVEGEQAVTMSLKNGSAKARLGALTDPGKVKVKLTYLGDATTESETKKVTIKVVR